MEKLTVVILYVAVLIVLVALAVTKVQIHMEKEKGKKIVKLIYMILVVSSMFVAYVLRYI